MVVVRAGLSSALFVTLGKLVKKSSIALETSLPLSANKLFICEIFFCYSYLKHSVLLPHDSFAPQGTHYIRDEYDSH